MHPYGRIAAASLLAALLSGCVSVRPTIAPSAAPAASSGYVAGIFHKDSPWGFGLGLVDAAGMDYVMPFGDPANVATGGRLATIAVPPGEYRVGYWVTYATMTKSREGKKDFPREHPLASRFTVKPGEVVLLGAFTADSSNTSTGTGYRINWNIAPKKIGEQQAVQAFRTGYPAFGDAPVR